tara:strand:+ start:148 stop:759 length:612 start_codon:yes stop_codon:yes gene_type:complete
MKKIIFLITFLFIGTVNASVIEFIPPNDLTGAVYTTNNNDMWSGNRGIGFNVSSSQTLSSVGVYQDLTNIMLNYSLLEISASSGAFTDLNTLSAGSRTVSTNGLEWIDFNFSDIALDVGSNYLLEFSFSGNSNQNFFYINANQSWSQDGFNALEGTAVNSFSNFSVGAFRVNGAVTTVSAPATVALFALGLAGISFSRKRKAS